MKKTTKFLHLTFFFIAYLFFKFLATKFGLFVGYMYDLFGWLLQMSKNFISSAILVSSCFCLICNFHCHLFFLLNSGLRLGLMINCMTEDFCLVGFVSFQ